MSDPPGLGSCRGLIFDLRVSARQSGCELKRLRGPAPPSREHGNGVRPLLRNHPKVAGALLSVFGSPWVSADGLLRGSLLDWDVDGGSAQDAS